jgi:hypothetical protein
VKPVLSISGSTVKRASSNGNVYVADWGNDRVQYFNRNEPAVVPASLGRVKALFR